MDDLDVRRAGAVELVGQPLEHQRRHVDRDDAPADRGSGERELPGAGAEVDDGGSGVQDAELLQQRDLLGAPRVLLGVVAARVLLVEVLAPGVDRLLQPPGAGVAWHQASSRRKASLSTSARLRAP